MGTTVWETLEHYHQLRTKYGRKRPRKIAAEKTREDAQHIEQFLTWCGDQQLPPRLFMEKRFEAMYRASRKKVVPRTSQLASERLAKCWPRVEQDHYSAQHVKRVTQAQGTTVQINVRALTADPMPYQEDVKRQNAGMPEGCLAMQKYSGGYHPKSDWCKGCACKAPCAEQLRSVHGFDVVALRTGRYQQVPNHILRAAFA